MKIEVFEQLSLQWNLVSLQLLSRVAAFIATALVSHVIIAVSLATCGIIAVVFCSLQMHHNYSHKSRTIAIVLRSSQYHRDHFSWFAVPSWLLLQVAISLQLLSWVMASVQSLSQVDGSSQSLFANHDIAAVALATCRIIAVAVATYMIIVIALCKSWHPWDHSRELLVHCDHFLQIAVSLQLLLQPLKSSQSPVQPAASLQLDLWPAWSSRSLFGSCSTCAIALTSCRFITITFCKLRYHHNCSHELWHHCNCFCKSWHLCAHSCKSPGIIAIAFLQVAVPLRFLLQIAASSQLLSRVAVTSQSLSQIAASSQCFHESHYHRDHSCESRHLYDRFHESLGIAVALGISCNICNRLRSSQIHSSHLSQPARSSRLFFADCGICTIAFANRRGIAVALGNSCNLLDHLRKSKQTRMEIAMEVMTGRWTHWAMIIVTYGWSRHEKKETKCGIIDELKDYDY